LERSLPTLKGMGQRALDVLHCLDAVHEDITRLQEQNTDLRPERARLDSIEEALRGGRAPVLVREVARSVGWAAARTPVAPGRERWWWYLDEHLAQQRRSILRRRLNRGGIALLVLVLLVGAYQRFLAPSPETRRKIALVQRAEQYLEKADLDQAIASYEEALAVEPEDLEVQLRLGVLYRRAGRQDEAYEAFRLARASSPSMVQYFLLRSRIHLLMGMLDEAASDVLAALSLDPESPQALFVLADVLEQEGNYGEAMALFQKVSLEAEEPALQVLAKVRYGMLLEAGPSLGARSITPTVEEDIQ
jgi:Tfp pilus assembly protein PilF